MSAPNQLKLWTPWECQGGGDTPWMPLSPGRGLLTQWLIHCRYPPSESRSWRLSASGWGYLTDTGGPQTKDQSNELNPCHSLEDTVNPNKVTERPNQFHLVELAFQLEVQQLARPQFVLGLYMTSSSATALPPGGRGCGVFIALQGSVWDISQLGKSVMVNAYQPRDVHRPSVNKQMVRAACDIQAQ